MRTKSYSRAEELYRRHRRDPLADLLDDTRAALSEAESEHEKAAIINAASDAADTLTTDLSLKADFAGQVAALTIENEPYTVWSDQHQRSVSVDDLAAENPKLAKVLEAVRGSQTADEAWETLRAAYAATEWTLDEYALLEGVREFEIIDDGSLASPEARQAAEDAARLAEAGAELEANESYGDRLSRLIDEAVAARETGTDTDADTVSEPATEVTA